MIHNYNDFITTLLDSGFSMAGGNNEGIYSIITWNWNEAPPYDTAVCWHNGDLETDPWEWRMRVLDERNDIAYAKLFFKKGGYITKEWYPYFLAARRMGKDFDDEYENGKISYFAKRIYKIIAENEIIPLHIIKKIVGLKKDDASKFDRALIELQMKMYVTMCGKQRKLSNKGEEFGWSSTVFCTVEKFFANEIFDKANNLSEKEAIERISDRILSLNPLATSKKIIKFIKG